MASNCISDNTKNQHPNYTPAISVSHSTSFSYLQSYSSYPTISHLTVSYNPNSTKPHSNNYRLFSKKKITMIEKNILVFYRIIKYIIQISIHLLHSEFSLYRFHYLLYLCHSQLLYSCYQLQPPYLLLT